MTEDLLHGRPGVESAARPVSKVAEALGTEAYLVGGTVRDLLVDGGKAAVDIDVSVTGDATTFGKSLARMLNAAYVPLAEERGTVRVVTEDRTVYDVSAALGGSVLADLGRRDFTINAMAFGPLGSPGASLIDPFDGLEDLRAQIVRSVSSAAFADDPLRTMRAFRFAATLGFAIEPQTLSQVAAHAGDLAGSAPERVARELFLTLSVPSAACVRAMDSVGVLPVALPETDKMRGVTQNEYHHLDVWGHSLQTLACLDSVLEDLPSLVGAHVRSVEAFLDEELVPERPRAALLRFSALLHDLGKPDAREETPEKVTFYTHSRLGAEEMREVCARLRLSGRETEEAVTYVDRHLVPSDLEASRPLSDKRLFRFFRRSGERGVALLLMALADGMATRGPASDPERTKRMRRFAGILIGEYYDRVRPRLETPPLVTGRDLIGELGVRPGPPLGRLLEEVRERQLSGELSTRRDALDHVERLLHRMRRRKPDAEQT